MHKIYNFAETPLTPINDWGVRRDLVKKKKEEKTHLYFEHQQPNNMQFPSSSAKAAEIN